MTWKYAIKKLDDMGDYYALVERYMGGDLDGAYAEIFTGGETRSDLIHTLQLMVLDTFKDKEFEKLKKMFAARKLVKKKVVK